MFGCRSSGANQKTTIRSRRDFDVTFTVKAMKFENGLVEDKSDAVNSHIIQRTGQRLRKRVTVAVTQLLEMNDRARGISALKPTMQY